MLKGSIRLSKHNRSIENGYRPRECSETLRKAINNYYRSSKTANEVIDLIRNKKVEKENSIVVEKIIDGKTFFKIPNHNLYYRTSDDNAKGDIVELIKPIRGNTYRKIYEMFEEKNILTDEVKTVEYYGDMKFVENDIYGIYLDGSMKSLSGNEVFKAEKNSAFFNKNDFVVRIYRGEISDKKKQGYGKYTTFRHFPNGNESLYIKEGNFDDNKLIKGKYETNNFQGKLKHIYNGEFDRYMKLNGENCTWSRYFNNQLDYQYKGACKNGKFIDGELWCKEHLECKDVKIKIGKNIYNNNIYYHLCGKHANSDNENYVSYPVDENYQKKAYNYKDKAESLPNNKTINRYYFSDKLLENIFVTEKVEEQRKLDNPNTFQSLVARYILFGSDNLKKAPLSLRATCIDLSFNNEDLQIIDEAFNLKRDKHVHLHDFFGNDIGVLKIDKNRDIEYFSYKGDNEEEVQINLDNACNIEKFKKYIKNHIMGEYFLKLYSDVVVKNSLNMDERFLQLLRERGISINGALTEEQKQEIKKYLESVYNSFIEFFALDKKLERLQEEEKNKQEKEEREEKENEKKRNIKDDNLLLLKNDNNKIKKSNKDVNNDICNDLITNHKIKGQNLG